MTDFLKIAKSIVVHFAHICAYSVETVKMSPSSSRNSQDPSIGTQKLSAAYDTLVAAREIARTVS